MYYGIATSTPSQLYGSEGSSLEQLRVDSKVPLALRASDLLSSRRLDIAAASYSYRERSGVSRRALTRYSRCKETSHNSRTCKKDTLDSN